MKTIALGFLFWLAFVVIPPFLVVGIGGLFWGDPAFVNPQNWADAYRGLVVVWGILVTIAACASALA